MAQRPFRFVHASDLLLDEPVQGLSDAPEGLQSRLIAAPIEAAENVFDTALNEQAAFLLLSGNVVDLDETDAFTLDFLHKQFERLNREHIAVYWAGGPLDPPSAWPFGFPLPSNVHCFPTERLEEVLIRLEDEPLVKILGHAYRGDAEIEWGAFEQMAAGSVFSIGVLHARTQLEDHVEGKVDYWALGGRNRNAYKEGTRAMAQYPGTPQGRRPGDYGPHGCAVVHVTADGRCATRLQPADVLRWRKETLSISSKATSTEIEQKLREKWKHITDDTTAAEHLVVFEFTGEGPLYDQIRRQGAAKPWLDRLRKEVIGKVKAWPVSVETPPPHEWPARLLERRTMVGDFLREAVESIDKNEMPFDLAAESEGLEPVDLPLAWIQVEDSKHRARLLAETARLGADLLQSEEAAL